MLKISLIALVILTTCRGRRLQRQDVIGSAPYPPSGFIPSGNGFKLPTERELPEVELLDDKIEVEEFNRLRLKPSQQHLFGYDAYIQALLQQQSQPVEPNFSDKLQEDYFKAGPGNPVLSSYNLMKNSRIKVSYSPKTNLEQEDLQRSNIRPQEHPDYLYLQSAFLNPQPLTFSAQFQEQLPISYSAQLQQSIW